MYYITNNMSLMMEAGMQEMLKKVITDILTTLYEPFWFALLSALLLTIAYMYCYEPEGAGKGFKPMMLAWLGKFKKDEHFRELFFWLFLTVIILFRTLLNRKLWANPLSNVMEGWQFIDDKGNVVVDSIENIIMLIPWTWLLIAVRNKKNAVRRPVMYAVKSGFLFSISIEMLQLILRLGTFQLSDICYNTLGGMIGGVMFWITMRIKNTV